MELPSIYCPLPSAIHPGAEQANAQSVTWMMGHALCPNDVERARLARSNCGLLAARIVPTATPELLRIVSDFFIWNVSFDDEYCDEGPLSDNPGEMARVLSLMLRTLDVPESLDFSEDKYARAMLDIRLRLERHASPGQIRQWIEAMRGWFLAEIWKAGNISAHRMPTLNEYALLRLHSGGAMVFPVLARIATGDSLPQTILDDRRLCALTEISATLCTWVADIVSYQKELERELGGHNLVMVIQYEHQCSMEQGAQTAIAMYNSIMLLFERLRDHVMAEYPESMALQHYLRSLEHFIRSAVDWCHLSERYMAFNIGQDVKNKQTHPASLPQSLLPENIPALSWWWQYDPARERQR